MRGVAGAVTVGMMLVTGAASMGAQAKPGNHQGEMAAVVKPFLEHHVTAGVVVLVADRDKIIDLETLGYKDIAKREPMRADTMFFLASMTKSQTSAMVMSLVDEGKIGLDDPVAKYLPEFKDMRVMADPPKPTAADKGNTNARTEDEKVALAKDVKTVPAESEITVRELLSHTAGLWLKSPIDELPWDTRTIAATVHANASEALLYQPGKGFKYSNAGITTAARIAEVVTGEPYDKLVQERVWTPLGMKDATFYPTAEQMKRIATAYEPGSDTKPLRETANIYLSPNLMDRAHRYPLPAAGSFATVNDLYALCQMMLNKGEYKGKRVLSAASVEAMARKETGPDVNAEYGLGWYSSKDGKFNHGGAFRTDMQVDPKTGMIVIFLEADAGAWPEWQGVMMRTAILDAAAGMFAGDAGK